VNGNQADIYDRESLIFYESGCGSFRLSWLE